MKLASLIFIALTLTAETIHAACVSDLDCDGAAVCVKGICEDANVPVPKDEAAPTTETPARPDQAAPRPEEAPAEAKSVDTTAPAKTPPAAAAEASTEPTAAPAPPPPQAPPSEEPFWGYMKWASIRVGGGTYGGALSISWFTLHLRWFYWSILTGGWGGGRSGGNDSFAVGYYAKGGTRMGIPFHIGRRGKHEIRLGVGVAGGVVELTVTRTWYQSYQEWFCTSNGPFLEMEALYQLHLKRRLAILFGYEATFVFNYVNDNGHPSDNWEPADVHAWLIGIAF